jgi:hypothetical protein
MEAHRCTATQKYVARAVSSEFATCLNPAFAGRLRDVPLMQFSVRRRRARTRTTPVESNLPCAKPERVLR